MGAVVNFYLGCIPYVKNDHVTLALFVGDFDDRFLCIQDFEHLVGWENQSAQLSFDGRFHFHLGSDKPVGAVVLRSIMRIEGTQEVPFRTFLFVAVNPSLNVGASPHFFLLSLAVYERYE